MVCAPSSAVPCIGQVNSADVLFGASNAPLAAVLLGVHYELTTAVTLAWQAWQARAGRPSQVAVVVQSIVLLCIMLLYASCLAVSAACGLPSSPPGKRKCR